MLHSMIDNASPYVRSKEHSLWLSDRYCPHDEIVHHAAKNMSPHQFLRLFITAYGMLPTGTWQTHTYAQFHDSVSQKEHFFLIPMQKQQNDKQPRIQFKNGFLYIDDVPTNIKQQSIPHTSPFWYFHYSPNQNDKPYRAMTLNFSPSCLEKCVLCAGAKTGRVNNGMNKTLSAKDMLTTIFTKHPNAIAQLESVAIVTGCFNDFTELKDHLGDVRHAVHQFCQPKEFLVLEHNIETNEQLDIVIRELGYDIFITLECYDQNIRNIALNGKVGRKGRDSKVFLNMIKNYVDYLARHSALNKNLIRVTYLVGLDPLPVMEDYFKQLAALNKQYQNIQIVPWLSIFTSYNKGMSTIQNKSFNLVFILQAMALAEKYFSQHLLLEKYDNHIIYINDDLEMIGEAIAFSSERIGAIVISNFQNHPHFYKKIRELASAENALLIFDETGTIDNDMKIDRALADVLLFHFQGLYWLASPMYLYPFDSTGYILPCGKSIAHLRHYETDFVYQEIFVDDCYRLKHMDLPNDAVIFDIGANIGLFTLFVKEKYPHAKIYAFEPCPHIFHVLCQNTKPYIEDVHVFNDAISDTVQKNLFHYYQDFSVISSFHAHQTKDAEIIFQGMGGTEETKPEYHHVIEKRLKRLNSYECESTTISMMIKENKIPRIDLLKIDVEGHEWQVLQGIEINDWHKIMDLRIEVHSTTLLHEIISLLTDKNYHINVESDKNLANANIYNLIATKNQKLAGHL